MKTLNNNTLADIELQNVLKAYFINPEEIKIDDRNKSKMSLFID